MPTRRFFAKLIGPIRLPSPDGSRALRRLAFR